MSDIPTREAELIARHAARDAYWQTIFDAAAVRSIVSAYDIDELSTQQIAITDAAVVTLTVPSDAIGATIQAVLTTGGDTIRFTVDGVTTPSDTLGFALEHIDSIDIGKTPLQPGGDPDELANFKAIAATGFVGYIRVIYYKKR